MGDELNCREPILSRKSYLSIGEWLAKRNNNTTIAKGRRAQVVKGGEYKGIR
jgi:hypothetical protein